MAQQGPRKASAKRARPAKVGKAARKRTVRSRRKPASSAGGGVGRPSRAPSGRPARKVAASAAGDWRERRLEEVRALIREALPGVVEERKWRKPSNPAGVAVWSRDGPVCTGETYKDAVKLTFFRGAALGDPGGLFNAGLGGGTRRAIDLRKDDRLDEAAFKALVQEAAALNAAAAGARS